MFVRRSSSCATDESWTGVRRTNEIGARSARPASGSRTFSGVPACRGVRRRGSRRVRQEAISRLPSPPRTSISSVAVKPKPNQVYATSK
jgi:hypothetical protein